MEQVILEWASGMLLLIVMAFALLWGRSMIKSSRDRKPRRDVAWAATITLGPIRYVVPPGGSWMHSHGGV